MFHRHKMPKGVPLLWLFLIVLNFEASDSKQRSGEDKPQGGDTRAVACQGEHRNISSACRCQGLVVDCSNLSPVKLTSVPVHIYNQSQELLLSLNNISRIEKNDFLSLECLMVLRLNDNRISWMDPSAFKNLYKLHTIDLSNNKLVTLDLTGRIFQHLTSLRSLNLTNNKIKFLNKFSFFTLPSDSTTVEIDLRNNLIECDCNTLGLVQWSEFLRMGRVSFPNATCKNDVQGNRIQDFEYVCDGTEEDVFNGALTCPRCQQNRTNHGCLLNQPEKCTDAESVCQTTVSWSDSERRFAVSSSCSSYQSCLALEAKNSETCGLNFQDSGDIHCNFCCRGPTCDKDGIAGRTKDFTFCLVFMGTAKTYQPSMSDSEHTLYQQEKQRVDQGIRGVINLKGGLEVSQLEILPGEKQRYWSIVQLKVTTFNTEAEESVLDSIKGDIKFSLANSESFFAREQIESHSLTTSCKEPVWCPESVSISETQGVITWEPSGVGISRKLCPFTSQLDPYPTFATRKCILKIDYVVEWEAADYSDCSSQRKQKNQPAEEIFNATISPRNAMEISAMLSLFLNQLNNFSVESVNQALNLLESFLNETLLQDLGVVMNVVQSVATLSTVETDTLVQLQPQTNISKRLLHVVDFVTMRAPLVNGRMVVATPNLTIAAYGFSANHTQDVSLIFNTENVNTSSRASDSPNFVISENNNTSSVSPSAIVIPTQALLASLTPEGKLNLSRISFVVHESDNLFTAMVGSECSRSLQAQKSFNTPVHNVSSNCQAVGSDHAIPLVNSQIMAASISGVNVWNLTENITLNFKHQHPNMTNPRCVYWDQSLENGTGGWSSEGCGVVTSSPDQTTCGCNHMTNFALLMDVYQEGSGLSATDRLALSLISYIGCGISLLALLLTFLTYCLFSPVLQYKNSDQKMKARKLRRDNPSKILINLCLALLLSNLVYVAGMHDYTFKNTASCKTVAVLLHYFLLASLTWMAVEAFYMYLALVVIFKTYFSHFLLKCSLIGWGVPAVIVITTLAVDATDNYGFINSGLCWLQTPAFYGAFVGPVGVILLINCFAFGLVVRQLIHVSNSKLNKTDNNSTLQRLRGAVGLVILLGLTWLFAVFAIGRASVVFYYLFAIFNSLQGLFIFVFHCLFKKDALLAWKRSLPCFPEYGDLSKSTSSTRAMAATHRLVKQNTEPKSKSSKLYGQSSSVATSLINSGESSYFQNTNGYHPEDSGEEFETVAHADTEADFAKYQLHLMPSASKHDDSNSELTDIDQNSEQSKIHINSPAKSSHEGSSYNFSCHPSLGQGQHKVTDSSSTNFFHQQCSSAFVQMSNPQPPATKSHPRSTSYTETDHKTAGQGVGNDEVMEDQHFSEDGADTFEMLTECDKLKESPQIFVTHL